jgi:L-amino acid N-acyltransferase YncA
MVDATELRTRSATLADAAAIAAIYNEGIADRIATFETEPRSAGQIGGWFTGGQLVIVGETEETGPVAFAALFPYSDRACYSGIGEFSVYVRRDYRGRGAGRAVLAALTQAAAAAGLHKLTSRVFPENAARYHRSDRRETASGQAGRCRWSLRPISSQTCFVVASAAIVFGYSPKTACCCPPSPADRAR